MHRVGFGTSNPIDILHTKTTNPTAEANAGCGINLTHNTDPAQRFAGIWFDADGGDLQPTSVGGFTKYYASITKRGGGAELNIINYDNSDIEFYVGGFQSNKKKVIIADNSDLKFNSGFGSVGTAYGVRAWATFNGNNASGTPTGGNVSSFTRTATGNFSLTMASAMPDTNYAVAAMASQSGLVRGPASMTDTTTVVKVDTTNGNGSAFANPDNITVLVVR